MLQALAKNQFVPVDVVGQVAQKGMFIKVWYENDFFGQFGGNNNEEVFKIVGFHSVDNIDKLVVDRLKQDSGDDEIPEGLYGWEFITMKELG